jgi:hypothetical protein
VKTGTFTSVIGDFSQLTNWLWGGVYQRVDLCPVCSRKRDATSRMWTWVLLALLVCAIIFWGFTLLIRR